MGTNKGNIIRGLSAGFPPNQTVILSLTAISLLAIHAEWGMKKASSHCLLFSTNDNERKGIKLCFLLCQFSVFRCLFKCETQKIHSEVDNMIIFLV